MVMSAIYGAVILAVFVRLVDGGGPWWFTGHVLEPGDWYEATRNTVAAVALTVAGAAAYLTYRRQRTADRTQAVAAEAQQTAAQALAVSNNQYLLAEARHDRESVNELRTRFAAAVELFAHPSAAVRMAGVYGLTSVADDWHSRDKLTEVQVCVDVLCGYLRLPYWSGDDSDHMTKRTLSNGHVQEEYEYLQNDRVVREAITRVISDHFRKTADVAWSDCELNLVKAHLFSADFSKCRFGAKVNLTEATIEGRASFRNSTFERDVLFTEAELRGSAAFGLTKFLGRTLFVGATFTSKVTMRRAIFERSVKFDRATFVGQNTFDGATFKHEASFRSSIFRVTPTFVWSTFLGGGDFEGAGTTRVPKFDGSTLNGKMTFGVLADGSGWEQHPDAFEGVRWTDLRSEHEKRELIEANEEAMLDWVAEQAEAEDELAEMN